MSHHVVLRSALAAKRKALEADSREVPGTNLSD